MKLTDTQIKNTKPRSKQYKLTDGQGMYLLVKTNGSKLWRLEYSFNNKRNTHAIGSYPSITLKEARKRLVEAKELLAHDIDPNNHRKEKKEVDENGSFEAVAMVWLEEKSCDWAAITKNRTYRRLEKDIFPWIGSLPITDIKPSDIRQILDRIQDRGALDIAKRVLQTCGQVFKHAIVNGKAEHDPTIALQGKIPSKRVKHHASITEPKKIGELLRAIDGLDSKFTTKFALQLAPLVFVRPGELRHAEWSEFDYAAKEWHIPAEKMKMPSPHIVPLSDQTLTLLSEIYELTGNGKYVFPSIRDPSRPMSENTVNAALRRLGYTTEEMTGHGFRTMASTNLNEMGWKPDVIEKQLAHEERNKIRGAYNRAEYLHERHTMMQEWANYLDKLKYTSEPMPQQGWSDIKAL